MASSKRQHHAMERELARALTRACESAKGQILGFEWLTHRVNYDSFPDSLIVTWVFDSESHLTAALCSHDQAWMHDLTQAAFEDIGISVADITRHLEFDCEERCAASHQGNWALRLASRQRSGSKHGKGH